MTRIVSTLRLLGALLIAAPLAAAQAGVLPAPVARALDAAGIPETAVAVWVQPVDGSAPSLQLNDEQPMNPASVMKLVTAFAALERLGPAHTWTTRVSATGPVRAGVLEGDLHVTGGADPLLTDERMWKLLHRLRALGIDTVRGDIVLDGSALRLPPHDPAAFDGRPLRPYNGAASGLLLHFGTLQLALFPPAPGERVAVAANPPLHGLELDNRIVSAAGDCGVWYSRLEAAIEDGPGGSRLVLQGSLPAACGRRDWAVAPLPPERFAAAAIAGLWAEIGGRLDGMVRPGTTPPDAAPLLAETSPPLADAVREMNKWSSNVIARELLATLGASDPASDDMVAAGARVARAQLELSGMATEGLVIENGSGLSRNERVTVRLLGDVLRTTWQRSYMPEFVAALPVAGVDGTARGRLEGSPAAGSAHVKTGAIAGVRAIGGYVLDRSGRRHAVAMIVNHPNAGEARPALDALLEWVWGAH